jgi:hypothetical protein
MKTHRQRAGIGACAVICAVMAALAGCSDDGEFGGGGDEVLDGLEGVRFTGEEPPEAVTVVDAVRANELLAADEERFAFVADMGTPLLSQRAVPEHRYGLDPANAEIAVTIGMSDPYGFWRGDFDEAAIAADLEADGFGEGQDGVWVEGEGEEGGVRLRVSGEEVAWGNGEGFDPAVLEEGERLAEVPRYEALAECLGEAYRADFVEGDEGEAVTAWAVGQLAESAQNTAEVMCVATADEESAQRVADALRAVIEEDRERYGGAEVTEVEGEVPGARVMFAHEAENQRPGWVLREDLDLLLALNA